MSILIRKAERKKAKLRLGIAAPSGAGKTFGALQIAFGLGGKIGLIDTENGSGDLYAHLGDYDIIQIQAPYTVDKYRAAIKAFEDAEYTTIIIDSLSHAWAGDGGLLDKQGKIADSGRSGNGYAAWRQVTPDHNALVEAMLQSPCHIIATMRSKIEYVLEEDDKGRKIPKKVGMAPVQRDGMEYEFTIMLDVDIKHYATPSKDRTSLFDGQFFKLSPDIGKTLLDWLETGRDVAAELIAEADQIIKKVNAKNFDEMRQLAVDLFPKLPAAKKDELTEAMKKIKAKIDAAAQKKADAAEEQSTPSDTIPQVNNEPAEDGDKQSEHEETTTEAA